VAVRHAKTEMTKEKKLPEVFSEGKDERVFSEVGA
jgi:hypothetical protein